MSKEEIEKDIVEIINKHVFIPKMVAGLETFIADYIDELVERHDEECYDRYYGINQGEEQ